MKARLDWARDGADWPNRAQSRFVRVGPIQWHVQEFGKGRETLLLLHGTGASTHSWRDLAPVLGQTHRVVAMDLPGHGFTRGQHVGDQSLPGMARAVGALIEALKLAPAALIGHSAGAAVAVRMALDGQVKPRAIIGFNAALLPFPGPARKFAPQMAKLLFLNPFAPAFFAVQASEATVARLIKSTGSRLDLEGLKLYGRLFSSYAHVSGALAMMAHWDLEALARDLPRLGVPLTLIVGDQDRAIAPTQADDVMKLTGMARKVVLPGLGHLAHEEAPALAGEAALKALGQADRKAG